MLARVWSAAIVGIDAIKVGVEVDISGGLPAIVVVGLPDAAVQESRERTKAALKNAGFPFPMRKIVINLTPADLRKAGPSFDLPIGVGILAAADQVKTDQLDDFLFLGEMSLDGGLRPVAGVLAIAAAAQRLGFKGMVVPADNAQEAAVGWAPPTAFLFPNSLSNLRKIQTGFLPITLTRPIKRIMPLLNSLAKT
jgi:magnesium chelatase family protein